MLTTDLTALFARLATALLGPKCSLGCGQRVYPKDLHRHLHTDHAGDTRLT